MRTSRLLRIELTVSDLEAAAAFYAALPDFVVDGRDHADPAMAALLGATGIEQVRLRRGAQTVLLQRFDRPGAPYPADAVSFDQSFQHFAMPVRDAHAAARGLPRGASPISQGGAQLLPARSGGATAFKFRDADGHPLEFIQFAEGDASGGVDHSAIVSADVERSIAFYRDTLGFAVGSRQTNRGPEQDRLDGVTDAVVDVVALEPAEPTLHVELLGYRSPPVRPAPRIEPRDIAGTRLVLAVDALPSPGVRLVDGSEVALLRDPDGHLLLLHRQG